MKIAREFEKRLERLVDGISAAVFRGRLHPVDLANRLVRQADLMVVDGPAGPEIPNHFVVTVSNEELDHDLGLTDLERELAAALAFSATERGWRTGGPIQVEIRLGERPATGSIGCEATNVPGQQTPWGQLVEATGERAFPVADNRVVVGRSPEADVVLSEPEVSRRHALVFREAERIWLADLGSANGTSLNGRHVDHHPVSLLPGDVVTFGPVTFTFRLL